MPANLSKDFGGQKQRTLSRIGAPRGLPENYGGPSRPRDQRVAVETIKRTFPRGVKASPEAGALTPDAALPIDPRGAARL